MEINQFSDRFPEEENISKNLVDSFFNGTSGDIEELRVFSNLTQSISDSVVPPISKDWRDGLNGNKVVSRV